MAMGKRKSEQTPMWVPTTELPVSPGHPFYAKLNAVLDEASFDRFAETECQPFYAPVMGRPSLPPGRYFRLLLVGYFEGLDSERGIAWRAADSLAVRQFVGLALDTAAPDHSTLSRTRRLIALEAHRAVFTWVQERLATAGLLKGRTVGIDATTLEANAAMRSIVRRDTGDTYQEFLTQLATESGIRTPTREALARLDRRRKKRTSNTDWHNPSDPDAKITKMKDGRTHLAHKAEHAIDLDSGALVAVTLHGAPNRGRRQWTTAPDAQRAVYGNRRRVRGGRGPRLLRRRGEYVERSFAHVYDTGGMRRTHLRGHRNILKRLLVHASAFNLGLLMRPLCGRGTPRGLQGRRLDARSLHMALLMLSARLWMTIGALLAHCRRPLRVLHPHPAWAIA